MDNKFDWVGERSKCSVASIFENLKTQIEGDVKRRNALHGTSETPPPYQFHFGIENDTISVRLEGSNLLQSVSFRLRRNTIEVLDHERKPMFTGTATLNNDGECRIKVNAEELTSWQFRKKALEYLFFVAPDEYIAANNERFAFYKP